MASLKRKHREVTGLNRRVKSKGKATRSTAQGKTKTLRPYQRRIVQIESKKRNPFIIINGPTGSGKSFSIQLVAALDRTEGRKVVISTSSNIVGSGFTAPTTIPVYKSDEPWAPSNALCGADDLSESKTELLKTSLLLPVNNDTLSSGVIVCTHAALVAVWKTLTPKQRRAALNNTAYVIDEAHHVLGAHDEEEDDLNKDERKRLKSAQTELGKIVHSIVNSDDRTAYLVLATATLYRGDEFAILSQSLRAKFVPHYCSWTEYWEQSGFEQLDLRYELYTGDPLALAADNIQSQRKRKHIVYFPSVGRLWCEKDSVQKFVEELTKQWPGVRILDLVNQNDAVRSTNTGRLLAEPKSKRQGRSKYDVVLLCGMEEGLDWPVADTLHSLLPPRTLTKNVQRNGRIYRMWEGKRKLVVHNYLSDNNSANTPDEYKQVLEEWTMATLVGMQCDDLAGEIFVGVIPKGMGEAKAQPLSVVLGEVWESVLRDIQKEYTKLRVHERKDYEHVLDTVGDVVDAYCRDNDEISRNRTRVVSALMRQLARTIELSPTVNKKDGRYKRQNIGLKMSSGVFGAKEWGLLMGKRGAAELDLLTCSFGNKTSGHVRDWMRRDVIEFEEKVRLVADYYKKRAA